MSCVADEQGEPWGSGTLLNVHASLDHLPTLPLAGEIKLFVLSVWGPLFTESLLCPPTHPHRQDLRGFVRLAGPLESSGDVWTPWVEGNHRSRLWTPSSSWLHQGGRALREVTPQPRHLISPQLAGLSLEGPRGPATNSTHALGMSCSCTRGGTHTPQP